MERKKEQEESKHNETTTKDKEENFLGRGCSQWLENLESNKSCWNKPENVFYQWTYNKP